MQRENSITVLYIDAANLIIGSKNFLDKEYDLFELLVYLKDRYRAQSCVYFTGRIAQLDTDYKKLEEQGVQLVFKQIYREDNKTKANCDVEISHKITYDLEHELIDNIVLVSGDGDFVSLLDYARNKINSVQIFSVSKYNTSRLLRERRYLKVTYLSDLVESIKGTGPTGHVVPAGRLFINHSLANPKDLSSNGSVLDGNNIGQLQN